MKTYLKYGIGFLLLILLLRFVDWQQSTVILLGTKPLPILLIILLLSFLIILSSLKWHILLRAQGITISMGWLIKCYWISSFFANYLPSNVGGDVVRLMMMHHLKRSAQVAASIFLERLTGFVVLLGFSSISLLMHTEIFLNEKVIFVVWSVIASVITGLVLVFLFDQQVKKILIQYTAKWEGFLGHAVQKMNKFFASLLYFHAKKKEVVQSLMLSVPFYCVTIVCQYLIFAALGQTFPLQKIIFIAPLISLVSALPISPNGLGVAEATFVVLYVQAGMVPEVALAASVLRRVVNVLVSLLGGMMWLTYQSKANRLVE